MEYSAQSIMLTGRTSSFVDTLIEMECHIGLQMQSWVLETERGGQIGVCYHFPSHFTTDDKFTHFDHYHL